MFGPKNGKVRMLHSKVVYGMCKSSSVGRHAAMMGDTLNAPIVLM
jgi:hypothetical protein